MTYTNKYTTFISNTNLQQTTRVLRKVSQVKMSTVQVKLSVDAEEKVSVTIVPRAITEGPKRKPFPSKKQSIGTDAGEWIVRVVDGKRMFIRV